jgi:hypothetical protein
MRYELVLDWFAFVLCVLYCARSFSSLGGGGVENCLLGIADFEIADFGIADFGTADFAIADFGIADFGIADFGTKESNCCTLIVPTSLIAYICHPVIALMTHDVMS